MTKIYTDAIEPASGTTLNIGESGANTVLTGNDLRANVVQDKGGNALFTSNGSGVLSGVASAFGSPLVLINTLIASTSASLEITSGITTDYKELEVRFIGVRGGDDSSAHLGFQCSIDGGSNYNTNITCQQSNARRTASYTGAFVEDNTVAQYNGTGMQALGENFADNTTYGIVYGWIKIYNPSSTTYVKGFTARVAFSSAAADTSVKNTWTNGAIDTTSAIDAMKFSYSAGNIIAGKIKIYGYK